MKINLLQKISLAVISLLLPVTTAAAQESDIAQKLEENIRGRIAFGLNPGISIGIIDENGTRYYGYGDTALNFNSIPNKDTVYEIGHITQTFTGLLLADMLERGLLQLSDPVQNLAPDSINLNVRDENPITLLSLATHRSGLPYIPITQAREATQLLDPYSLSEMLDFLPQYSPSQDVDEKMQYSFLGYGLLGYALASKSDLSYEELLRSRILAPLDMANSGITLSEAMQEKLAPRGKLPSNIMQVSSYESVAMAPAVALKSSAEDMLKYLAVNLGLAESTLDAATVTSHLPRSEFIDWHIGLGWFIRGEEDETQHFQYGSTRGYSAFLGFSKSEKKGVVVLTNSNENINDIGHFLLDPSTLLPTAVLSRRVTSLNFISPESPPEAKLEGISGYVLTEFTIDSNGHTKNIKIVESDPPEIFEDSALEAAGRLRYTPRIDRGRKVEVHNFQHQFQFNN